MYIVVRRVDDLCWSCPGDQQGIRLVKPHYTLPEMKQAKPQCRRQHEDEQDSRPFAIDIHNLGKSYGIAHHRCPTNSHSSAPKISNPITHQSHCFFVRRGPCPHTSRRFQSS